MPGESTRPGVHIEEVPRGPRTIDWATTSVTAFVGRTRRGPTETPVTVAGFAEFERAFGGLWDHSRLGFSVRDFFRNGGSTAIIVRLFGGDGDTGKATVTCDTLTVAAVDPGAWGNQLRLSVDHDAHDSSASLFNLLVRDGSTGVVEEHRGVTISVAGHPRHLREVLERESSLIRLAAPAAGGTDVRPGECTDVAAGDEGHDGIGIVEADFVGPGTEAGTGGLFSLEDGEPFNLLVIPPYTTTDDVEPTLVTAAQAYCERRRAFLVVDGPSAWTTVEAVTSATIPSEVGTITRNGALFFPRLRLPNPLHDDRVEVFPAAGAVAGVIARTDSRRGVWNAPAGTAATLVGVPELALALSDEDTGRLNPIAVNCLRSLPEVGCVVWGSRTGEGADELASEWKYVPVRRTALFLEESLSRGLQWAVFEPNDERLWIQIRLSVGAFLHDLFRRGAFQGQTPREAYFLECDEQTTTQADIDLGIVNVLVGFAPLKPAEFIVLRIRQVAGQRPEEVASGPGAG